MKNHKVILAEFVANVSEEDLRFLASRLIDRYSNDLPEALNYLSTSSRIDAILSSSSSAGELFDYCDSIRDAVVRECKKRGISTSKPVAA